MLYLANQFLQEREYKDLRERLLMSPSWVDGALSAIGQAKKIKRNLQLNMDKTYEKFSEEIIDSMKNDDLINNFTFSAHIFNLLFTRTGVGMYYGPHVDSPYIENKRRDFSFTIFLNEPNEYKGGELILNIPPEKKSIKLKAGQIIVYPTKYLHEVKEVTEGERMVCVGWIESQIPRDDDREILSLLQRTKNEIVKNHGFSSSTINLNVAFNNLYKRFLS